MDNTTDSANTKKYFEDIINGFRDPEISQNVDELKEVVEYLGRRAASSKGDDSARKEEYSDAEFKAQGVIFSQTSGDNGEPTMEMYMDLFDKAYWGASASNTVRTSDVEYVKQGESDDTFYALGENAARMAGALTDEDAREQIIMDARNDAVQEIIASGLRGDEEQRAMDVFDEALEDTLNSYDVRNMSKPVVSESGELNPGIYSVDDDVYRIGHTGAMSQFRHGAWRTVRAVGAKQDSEYKLKRRGEHAKASLLKTLGKTSESCLMCGKPLEDEDSIARGVGSSCAQKYGIR